MSSPTDKYTIDLCLFCLMTHHQWCQGGTCQCMCGGEDRLITDSNRATISSPREDGEQ